MEQLSGEHIAALIVTGVGVAFVVALRPHGDQLIRLARILAALILAAYVAEHVATALRGSWALERNLPLHLTDAVTLVAAAALWTRGPFLVELTYFWAFSGSLQAILTPDLGQPFPSALYFTYFITHAGAVLGAALLVFGLGITPRSGAVGRVFTATAGFAAVAGIGDLLTGGNYMFLRHKPGRASLLDLMGPWPWYIASAAALALVLFLLLDLPFRRSRPEPVARR